VTSAALALDDLRKIVGEPHVRAASPGDAVDGVAPELVVEPGSAEEAGRRILRENALALYGLRADSGGRTSSA
jgi:hypothetical protein